MRKQQIGTLVGCASIEVKDGGVLAQATMNQLRPQATTALGYHIVRKKPLPPLPASVQTTLAAVLILPLNTYFRHIALTFGEPCCADVPVPAAVREIDVSDTKQWINRATHG